MQIKDSAAKLSKPYSHPIDVPDSDSPVHGSKIRDRSFSSSPTLCSTYKLVALVIVGASVAALFFLRSTSDGAALLCVDRRHVPSHPSPITYPEISWTKVPPIHPLDPAAVAPFASFRSERWIVVSVSAPPTDALRLLVKTRGWQLLAVGNSHTPEDWSLKGAIFLSLDLQARLGFRTVDFLPYASYVRKSVGYLFAIQHGARVIYDGDDRSSILGSDLSKHFDVDLGEAGGSATGYPVILQYSRVAYDNRSSVVVNPYVHFGQRSVWPRGLPLENVRDVGHEEFYSEVRGGRQFLQQGLSNGLPDVDSVFYFSRKSSRSEPYDIHFDEDAPKVALPQGLMAPVNSFNTIFHSQAFWGLLLPVSVSSMASDVIRGYWVQRILWEIEGYVAFYPPTILRKDRAEAYPFSEEKDLHVNVARLINFLVSWRSAKPTVFERILDLSYAVAKAGFWTEKDVRLTAAWLQDLIAVGYGQPNLMSLELDRSKETSRHGVQRQFVPKKISSVHLGVDDSVAVNYEIGNLIRWRRSFGNVVLIMQCTDHVEHTALAWRLLYGRIFKTVVMLSEKNNTDIAVEYAESSKAYKYLPKVFERFPDAEGFVFLHDSMVLNYWNLQQADKGKLWITNKVPQSWVSVSIGIQSSAWFVKQAAAVKKVVNTLPVHFQVSYKDSTAEDKLIVCSSEVFYVPRRFVVDFVELVGIVGDLDMHHKVAVPLFFLAMDSQQNFDSDALAAAVYVADLPANGSSSLSHYTTRVPAVYPLKVQNEPDFIKLVQVMASGDPLLMELV